MMRFRKKSDAKSSQVPVEAFTRPVIQPVATNTPAPASLPEVPSVEDFRSSVIFSDLSRRFTLLRKSNGNTLTTDDIRNRFAEQRAKGATNQITEEEEDMLVEALMGMRNRNNNFRSRGTEDDTFNNAPFSAPEDITEFGRSKGLSMTSSSHVSDSSQDNYSLTSSPTSRSSKRHSNNLFGSGQFRDYRAIRQSARGSTNKHPSSRAISEKTHSLFKATETLAEEDAVAENAGNGSSTVDTDVDDYHVDEPVVEDSSESLRPTFPILQQLREQKGLSHSQARRISMSLEGLILEMEEEAGDKVLVPRSAPRTLPEERGPASDKEPKFNASHTHSPNSTMEHSWIATEPSGEYRSTSPASPVPYVPGYIPGMPRPMTPRNVDNDDQRANSTTPRAISPYSLERLNTVIHQPIANNLRRNMNSGSPPLNRPYSPFLRYAERSGTPEPRNGSGTPTHDPIIPSQEFSSRRPSSPLAGSTFHPLFDSSRSGTPSQVTWNLANPSSEQSSSTNPESDVNSSHNREDSSTSFANSYTSSHFMHLERSKSLTRSLQSPGLPDSPLLTGDYDSPSSSGKPSYIPPLNIGSSYLLTQTSPGTASSYSQSQRHITPFAPNEAFSDAPHNLDLTIDSPMISPQSSDALVLSPSSSSSSLVSAGSSFHSENIEGHHFSQNIKPFGNTDNDPPAWHDLAVQKRGGEGSTIEDPENVLRQFTGLTKSDIASIQWKLVETSQKRAKSPEPRVSAMRKRRPSVAHSIQSVGRESRATSPAPSGPVIPSFSKSADTAAKVNALLNSVVESISDARKTATTPPVQDEPPPSSPTQNNKDLADLIFGPDGEVPVSVPRLVNDFEEPETPPPSNLQPKIEPVQAQEIQLSSPDTSPEPSPPVQPSPPRSLLRETAEVDTPVSSSSAPSKVSLTDENQLLREIQQKTLAANAQLQKTSPNSSLRLRNAASTGRKRINLHDISSPQLVQSSTSVDKIPSIAIPVAQEPRQQPVSKFAARLSLKKFRGSLKSRPATSGDESTSWSNTPSPVFRNNPPLVQRSPLSENTVYTTKNFKSNDSPSPSIKGFMSRFRKRNTIDASEEKRSQINVQDIRPEHIPLVSPTSTAQLNPGLSRSDSMRRVAAEVPTTPKPSAMAISQSQTTVQPDLRPVITEPPAQQHGAPISSPASSSSPVSWEPSPRAQSPMPAQDAMTQFLNAAQTLGIDPATVDQILDRSKSLSSRNGALSPTAQSNASLNRSLSTSTSQKQKSTLSLSPRAQSPVSNRALSPVLDWQNGGSGPQSSSRSGSPLTTMDRLHVPRPRENAESRLNGNSIIRRTLIYPSEGEHPDLSGLMRNSSRNQRRTSNLSMQSGRSVLDRVPTPPPPARAKRFSATSSPPVPRLPGNLSSSQGPEISVSGGIESSRPSYDSSRGVFPGQMNGDFGVSSEIPTGEPVVNHEPRQAVEVIEMANGETIWQIVDGLRSEDTDSLYYRRASLNSEYSAVTHPESDTEQLFFKEHTHNRQASKGSNKSFGSRQKPAFRPETKVFYSSSAHIARLIEQLSHGAEAGSFNIKPREGPHHSHSSSFQSDIDGQWTIEERLDRMLGSMGGTS